MANANLKVIDFGNYLKSKQPLDLDAAETIVTTMRVDLRQLDADVIKLIPTKHKLRDIQKRKQAGKAVVASPRKIVGLKANFRNNAFNAMMTVSIAVVEANGIEPDYPNRVSVRHTIAIPFRR